MNGVAKVTTGVKRKLKTVKILTLKFCKQRTDLENARLAVEILAIEVLPNHVLNGIKNPCAGFEVSAGILIFQNDVRDKKDY